MNIFIIYATNSGGTQVAGRLVRDILAAKNHRVRLEPAASAPAKAVVENDVIVLGSPSWNFDGQEGMPHQTMLEFAERCKTLEFSGKLFALYGCGDSAYTRFCGAVDWLENFVSSHGGRVAVPSLKIDGFYFSLAQNSARVEQWARGLAEALTRRMFG